MICSLSNLAMFYSVLVHLRFTVNRGAGASG